MPWLLRGDVKSKLWFTNGGTIRSRFKDVVCKDLDEIDV
jgi:hypothetical protein